jgi:hypothetical protein
VRSREERRGWMSFLPAPSGVTVDTLGLVLEAPEFLTGLGHPDAPVRVAVPVIQPGTRTDRLLVAVDEAGGITLVGCPDAQHPESAVHLAGDMLGLVGRLWRMPVEQFLALVEPALGKSLAAAIHERAMPDWTDEQLLSGIAAGLESGRFPVVIVAGNSDQGARDALSFIKSLNLPVRLVGIAVYASSGIEVAAPVALGAAVQTPTMRPADAGKAASTGTFRPAPGPAGAGVARPAPASPTPPAQKPVPPPEKPAPQPRREPEPEGKGPAPGTKPGVMAGKRPPPAGAQGGKRG